MATVDLSVVGNGTLAALIDRTGRIVWCCWPALDGDPLFCGLLAAPGEGGFGVTLDGQIAADVVSPPDAAAVVTRLRDRDGGVAELVDLIPAGDPAPAELIRILRPVAGCPTARLTFDPRAAWGAHRPTLERHGHRVRLAGVAPEAWISADLADPVAALQGAPIRLDRPVHLVLGVAPAPEDPAGRAREALARTEAWWAAWFAGLAIPDGCSAVVRPAARALKLCCLRETGGIVAALTTSIPEEPGTGRTWDYRYCWLRDAYFTVRALARLGDREAVGCFGRWLDRVLGETGGDLQPLYGLRGERRLEERFADALPGYRGHGPVRMGNAACTQVQHDVYGQAVLVAELAGTGAPDALRGLGERAWSAWDRPDAGVWEYRGIAHVHTSSAAFCWAALDGLARRFPAEPAWRDRADRVAAGVLDRAWSDALGALSGALDEPLLDASVLLLPQLGLLPWTDPRFVATVDVLDRRLRRVPAGEPPEATAAHPHLMRYVAPDDFGAPSHAFTACSFWAIQALIGVGRRTDAEARFEQLLARRTVAGLLSEDLDPATGEGWGNYPQTYCAVGLVECALALAGPLSAGS